MLLIDLMAIIIFMMTIMIIIAMRYMIRKDRRIAEALDLLHMGEVDDAIRWLEGEHD